jgi:hypothetical protein
MSRIMEIMMDVSGNKYIEWRETDSFAGLYNIRRYYKNRENSSTTRACAIISIEIK